MKKKKQHKPQMPNPEEEPSRLDEAEEGEQAEGEEQIEIEKKSERAEFSTLPVDTEDISDWYHDDEYEGKVDMTKIDRSAKRNWWPWVFALVGVLVVGAALAFSYVTYLSGRPAAEGSARLELSVPEKTASGEAVVVEVTYENSDSVDFKTGKIEVVYPEGFVFESANPLPTSGQTNWELGVIPSGRGGKIYITGQLVGEVGSSKIFSSFFTYRPENLNYDFQEIAQAEVDISSSTIQIEIDSPEQAHTGQDIALKAEFKNTSSSPIKDVKAKVKPPLGFTVTSVDPEAPAPDDLSWRFDEIQPGESQTVTLRGTVQGESGQQQAFSFEAGFIEIDGRYNVQVEKQALVLLINPSIELKLDAPEKAAPGEKITYTVTATNTSDVLLKNVKLRLLLEGDYFTEEQLDLAVIDELAAQESKTVTATTTLKESTKARDLSLSAVVSVRQVTVDGEQTTITSTASVSTQVEGSLSFSAQARYFDDNLQKIGDGPIPPKVGDKTTYVIWWDVTSGPSDLKQFTVSAQLPDDVTFETSDPDITYTAKTRTVSYSSSVFKADTSKHLEFSVSITPTPDDFNGLMVLVEAGSAQAVDTSSNDTLTADTERLTTNLDGDPAAEGKGVVE
ncbi:MAG: hypothetical protein AAB558_00100 [Patescibacteria group bacterium]